MPWLQRQWFPGVRRRQIEAVFLELDSKEKPSPLPVTIIGMSRGDRLQTNRGHGLHIDWGVYFGKMSYQWNRNNDLLIWSESER
jgi:hypothetical protein